MLCNRRQFIQSALIAAAMPLEAYKSSTATQSSSGRKERPPMHRYDFSWDRRAHIRLSSRRLPREQSLYFQMDPYCPAALNQEGRVSYYDAEPVLAMRRRLAGLDRKAYLQDILDHILKDAHTDKERVAAICGFVGDAIYYNPIQQAIEPPEPGKENEGHNCPLITDPVELLELHDGRCGQGVTTTLALLEAAGIEARQVPAHHHVSCEARYDGGWHLADAMMFGRNQPHRDGEVLSAEEIRKDPYYTDGFPLPYLYGTPEEYLTADGFRCLGYCFGEWGTMPYHSWYWGAPKDFPPTSPYPLPAQRLGGQRVRLNWAPSFKAGGGEIEYRVEIFSDRDCKNGIYKATTRFNYLEWEVPQMNFIYYFEVAAMDDHRRFNPNTWYLPQRNNFMLVPEDQYGWYGVV